MKSFALQVWSALRRVSGDDAYERYLWHCRKRHPGAPVLSRSAFFRAELARKWDCGPQRCC
jgi:uncharacterized short protein YbdD (DUF466 family)